MRIVIDLQSCQSGSRLGGIGRYSIELAKAMARHANGHDLWVVLNNLLPDPESEIRYGLADFIPQDKIRVFEVPSGIAEKNNNRIKVRAAELVREHYLQLLNPDVVHISSLIEGLHEEVTTSVGNFFNEEKTAVTLYDLIPLVMQDRYLDTSDSRQHYMNKIEHIRKAGLLLSISEFARKEVIDLLDVAPERVVNISSAADKKFRPITVSQEHAKHLRKRYGIKQNFLMYTGSFDQRKNHSNLIRAFGLLPKNIRRNHQLLIVGNGSDAVYQELREIAKQVGLAEDEVIFSGRVSDDDLPLLYNLCDLFVFPSLAEGFGLPVLEAMSCVTPTICSNCTSLPEVIGRSDAQFDPHKPESIAKTMQRALSDKDFKQSLRDHGLKQSKNFSWDASARKTIEAFEQLHERLAKKLLISVMGKHRTTTTPSDITNRNPDAIIDAIANLDGIASLPDELLQEISGCIGINRYQVETISSVASGYFSNLHVGWVTTWNTRCGIASYSKFIAEYFPARQTVFAPEAAWTVMRDDDNVKRCWQVGRPDDLSHLYAEITNSNIDVVIVQFNYGFFDFESLDKFLQDLRSYGIRIFITLHSTQDPSESKRLSSIVQALAGCDGLFVHSINDVAVLKKLNLTNIMYLPQGIVEISQYPSVDIPITKSRIIATYGFALPNKGLIEVIDALGILNRDKDQHFHLLMVNAEYPVHQSAEVISDIRNHILELGLSDSVTLITDYLSDELSLGYLHHADLIVYAYQNTGESSSAAVRMGIAAGKPVAVTPNHIFGDVESIAFKLPGYEATEIASGIKEIFSQLDENNLFSTAVAENALLWRSAHAYSSISRHMFWTFAKPTLNKRDYYLLPQFNFTPSSEDWVLKASMPPLKTQVGVVTTTGIKTSGRPGALVFGPFISVAPGTYNVTVRGALGNGTIGSAKVDVTIGSGATILGETTFTVLHGASIISDLFFEVPEQGCLDLEIRVIVDAVSDFEVFEIELSPHH